MLPPEEPTRDPNLHTSSFGAAELGSSRADPVVTDPLNLDNFVAVSYALVRADRRELASGSTAPPTAHEGNVDWPVQIALRLGLAPGREPKQFPSSSGEKKGH